MDKNYKFYQLLADYGIILYIKDRELGNGVYKPITDEETFEEFMATQDNTWVIWNS